MANALAHHLQLAEKGLEQAVGSDVDAMRPAAALRPRHDFFPCVYNDAYVLCPESLETTSSAS
jgi:hypothetical protein